MTSPSNTRLTLISHHLCPYVQRAVIALTEKSVPFDRIDIDLAAKPDWFLALSPLGKTPVLKVADEPLPRSRRAGLRSDEAGPAAASPTPPF